MTRTDLSRVLIPSILFMLLGINSSCQKNPSATAEDFEPKPVISSVDASVLKEASGLAASRINNGFVWTIEDSGNPPQVILLSTDGKIEKKIYLKGAENRDWEEIAISKGPDAALDYLYVGDIGDNGSTHEYCTIYRFPEPSSTIDTVRKFDRIKFKYADGPHDAEAFLVDEKTQDIFILTKRDKQSRIYKLAAGYSLSQINTAEFVGELGYNGITAAAISPDGKDILVKTYTKIFRYIKTNGLSIPQALSSSASSAPYTTEPQGEAICFAADDSGYFTLSEKGIASLVNLYFYRRK